MLGLAGSARGACLGAQRTHQGAMSSPLTSLHKVSSDTQPEFQTDSNPECPGRSSTPSSPAVSCCCSCSCCCCCCACAPPPSNLRLPVAVGVRSFHTLAATVLQYRTSPAWSELPTPDVDVAKLRYTPRHAFRRSTPADPGKVCQAGASEQTLIPISLIIQHWPPRPKQIPKSGSAATLVLKAPPITRLHCRSDPGS